MSGPGYLFGLDSMDSLQNYIDNGIYGTKLSEQSRWSTPGALTMADYATMQEGDWVFFFLKRKIYGAGRLKAIEAGGNSKSVALCNYPRSFLAPCRAADDVLWKEPLPKDKDIRWVVTFEPAPEFHNCDLDMDEVLQADPYGQVKALRVFEKLSFIKMEPTEVRIILDLLARRIGISSTQIPTHLSTKTHSDIGTHLRNHNAHALDLDAMIAQEIDGKAVRLEAALQAWLAGHLTRRTSSVTNVFGEWDYVLNQVPASPFKPVMYMDKIDIVGFRNKVVFDLPTLSNLMVLEIKKDSIKETDVVGQVMKYVDWAAHNKAGGDYSMISAFIVAEDFSKDVLSCIKTLAKRNSVIPRRPYPTQVWSDLTLVRYKVVKDHIELETVVQSGTYED